MRNDLEYEKRFKTILDDLNSISKMDQKYAKVTESLCYLVGEMLGHIHALELKEAMR